MKHMLSLLLVVNRLEAGLTVIVLKIDIETEATPSVP
jgi:hypothetical protein